MADDPNNPRSVNPDATGNGGRPLPTGNGAASSPVAPSPSPDPADEPAEAFPAPEGLADDDAPDRPAPPRPTFLGEIVQKRSWPLIAIVFAFGVFLAVVPFLFQSENSPFTQALALYDRVCASGGHPVPADLSATARSLEPDRLAAALASMPCVPRADYLPRMDPVEGRQYGADRAFVVTLERRPSSPPSGEPPSLRYLVEEESGTVRWSPWPAGVP